MTAKPRFSVVFNIDRGLWEVKDSCASRGKSIPFAFFKKESTAQRRSANLNRLQGTS